MIITLNYHVEKMEFEIHVPIVFNFFNREETANKTFQKICEVRPRKLYLISDGPRGWKKGEKEIIDRIRKGLLEQIDWDCEVYTNFVDYNMGCKERIVSGWNWVFEREEMAILIEDDVLASTDFFIFVQEMLERYKNEQKVVIVSGWNPIADHQMKYSYTFTKFPQTWGWGTWARAWHLWDGSIDAYKRVREKGSIRDYLGDETGSIFEELTEEAIDGVTMNTWDYQFAANYMEYGGIGIIPAKNLITNIGFNSEEATHTTGDTFYNFEIGAMCFPLSHPEVLDFDEKFEQKSLELLTKELRICRDSSYRISCKLSRYYHMLDKWLQIKQENLSLKKYFSKKSYVRIGIYGKKELGVRLYDELKGNEFDIVCVIDQKSDKGDWKIPVVNPDEHLPHMDVIVVTASYYYRDIKEMMSEKVNCPIIKLDDVVDEIWLETKTGILKG